MCVWDHGVRGGISGEFLALDPCAAEAGGRMFYGKPGLNMSLSTTWLKQTLSGLFVAEKVKSGFPISPALSLRSLALVLGGVSICTEEGKAAVILYLWKRQALGFPYLLDF